jgi:hypothetical protein
MAEQKKSAKTGWIIRLLTILALLLVTAAAVRYTFLKLDLRRGAELYRQAKYREAILLLEPLSKQMLASIGLRARAERIVGLSKAELAAGIALQKRSIAGYDEALLLLEEAQRLAGPSKNFQDRIDEYTEYRNRLQADARKDPATEAPAPVPEGSETTAN